MITILLHIVDRDDKTLLIKDASLSVDERVWHLPGREMQEGESIDDTLQAITAEQLGWEISPRDCRHRLVYEQMEPEHRIYLIYRYRLLRPVLLTAWGETAEMTLCDKLPIDTAETDAAIMQKLKAS